MNTRYITRRADQIPTGLWIICVFQSKQISGLYGVHGLQIMLPGESQMRVLCSIVHGPGLDLFYTDRAHRINTKTTYTGSAADYLDRDLCGVYVDK